MLLHFRFANFKSFKELQDFSLIAGNTRTKKERIEQSNGYNTLKFSAIYGANAAGKSNIVDALLFMGGLIIIGLPSFKKEVYFKLDQDYKNKPTYFEIIVSLDNKIYSYGLEYLSSENKITSEWLTDISNNKNINIFERNVVEGTYIYYDKISKVNRSKLKMYLDDLSKDSTKLFLSYINSITNSTLLEELPILENLYNWILFNINITKADSVLTSGDYFIVEKKLKMMSDLLKSFDTGIIEIGKVAIPNEIAYEQISNKMIERIKEEYEQHSKKMKSSKNFGVLLRNNQKGLWIINIKNDDLKFYKVSFYHDKEKKYPFQINEESDGTIRILDLAEVLLTEENNQFFVIDELDRRLHPQLTCKFVELFLKKCEKYNNQLIVTTHESRLLDFNVLRRDEIWFVDKNKKGESTLYSLEEFNVRFDKRIDKAYLEGRYGGVPIFDTVFPIFNKWQE